MKAKSKPTVTQPSLVIDSDVVRKIRRHARSSPATEICGVLIGRDRDLRVEVTASIEGENADQAGAHVTFTQDTWEHIYAVKDKKYPDERIVGWYHSHPGFGIFLSEHDTFIHKNFFSSPGQVAWVFDPHSDEEGCFGWVNGQIERLTSIAVRDPHGGERAEVQADTGVPLSFRNESAITPSNDEPATPSIRVQRFEDERGDKQSSVSLEELVTKVFFSLALLVLGGVLSWYLFPHIVLMPVVLDPMTGNLIDPQTGQVVGAVKNANPEQVDPAKSAPSAPDAGAKKGNDAKSR